MKAGVLKETWPGETRVAIVPGVVPALVKAGIEVVGIDVHIGSQLTDLAPFEAAYLKVADSCEVCGEEIDIERLKSRPVTALCIGCKTHQERIERLTCA